MGKICMEKADFYKRKLLINVRKTPIEHRRFLFLGEQTHLRLVPDVFTVCLQWKATLEPLVLLASAARSNCVCS